VEALKRIAPELIKVLPELALWLPDVVPTVPLEPEQEKRRLFHTLAQFFTDLAARQPILIVVEDVHWSDDASLDFLLHLARGITQHPILLLLTYRSDEAQPSLIHLLAELDRARLIAELLLPRLERTDVDLMLRAIFDLDRPVRTEFLTAIFALTEGNPFFIEEVLKSLVATGDIFFTKDGWDRKPLGELRIPRSVRDVVERRTAQLGPGARQVLALAAVAGRRFDFALLQSLLDWNEEQLLQVIKELIRAQLVMEESADQFAFRHALTRQAVYASLLARERKVLHCRIAEAMERLHADTPDSHLANLAYHFFEAGVWEKAVAYAQRAGERAQALYAPQAAIEHFTRALGAAQRLGLPLPAGVYRARALAYETQGDFDLARVDHEQALRVAQATGDRPGVWQALIDLGLLWASRDYARTGDYYRQALVLARELDDPTLIGQSLNRMGNWHVNLEQPLEALRYHQEALARFQALSDRRGIAETLDLLGLVSYLRGDLLQGTQYYLQAVELAKALDNRQSFAWCLAMLTMRGATYQTDTMVPAATLVTAARDGQSAVKQAREIGWRSGEAYAQFILAVCLASQGQYGQALHLAHGALEIATEIEHRQWTTAAHCGLGAVYLDLFALQQARLHLEQALALAQTIGSWHWIRVATAFLASVTILQHEVAQAESLLDSFLRPDAPAETLGQRLCWSVRAELALARGEPALTLQIADQLLHSAPNVGQRQPILRPLKLRGEALAMLHQVTEAESTLLATQQTASAEGARPMLWRILVRLGQLYRTQGRHAEAERVFGAARAIIEELAASVPSEIVRSNFLQCATVLLPRPHTLTPRRAAKQAFSGLTAREREVATLIARGKSNRAIAQELILSERTVEGHVAAILSKLAFTTRTQIATWAVERGLASNGQ